MTHASQSFSRVWNTRTNVRHLQFRVDETQDWFVVHSKIQHVRYRSDVIEVQDKRVRVHVVGFQVTDKIDLEQAHP